MTVSSVYVVINIVPHNGSVSMVGNVCAFFCASFVFSRCLVGLRMVFEWRNESSSRVLRKVGSIVGRGPILSNVIHWVPSYRIHSSLCLDVVSPTVQLSCLVSLAP